jgi:hypothetical protein
MPSFQALKTLQFEDDANIMNRSGATVESHRRSPKGRVKKGAEDPHQISFVWQCPSGHMPTLTFDRTLLEDQLAAGGVTFYCGLCGNRWNPKPQEQRTLVYWLNGQ